MQRYIKTNAGNDPFEEEQYDETDETFYSFVEKSKVKYKLALQLFTKTPSTIAESEYHRVDTFHNLRQTFLKGTDYQRNVNMFWNTNLLQVAPVYVMSGSNYNETKKEGFRCMVNQLMEHLYLYKPS